MQTGILKNIKNYSILKNYITELENEIFGSESDPNITRNFFINQKNYFEQNLQHTLSNIDNYQSQIQELKDQIKKNEIAIQILEELKKIKIDTNKNFILTTINTAIKDIFQDDIEIDIVQENVRGKIKYNIVLKQAGIEIGSNDQLLMTNGGGVLSIISVLFKILIGYLYSKNKFFIFDESFSQVSPEYRERLSLFLRKFAEKYNFTIIIVSQTSDLNKYAHLLYKLNYDYETIENKKESIQLKRVYIEDKIENLENFQFNEYYYTEIKNFQSIKNINFEYKGLTVIVGPNNCGKSASLRAIKSILFNDFHEKYQRIGSKETYIKFGKKIIQNGSEIDHFIILKYKSKKVIFEIDGEQYLGKNLSSEVLKKKIEEIGFKYIDIKKLYKNIKGDLRKQVENISYASQYDNLFLIGNKANDIEKVFNFLFNTEKITSIIVEYKEKISGLETQINDLNKFLIQEKVKEKEFSSYLILCNYLIEFLTIKLYQKLIQTLNENNKKIIDYNTKLNQIQKLLLKYADITKIYNLLINYKTIQNKIEQTKKTLDFYNQIGSKIDHFKAKNILIDFKIYQDLFLLKNLENEIREKTSIIQKNNIKLEIIEKHQENYNNLKLDLVQKLIQNQDNFKKLTTQIEQLKILKKQKEKELKQIKTELSKHHLETCPYCQGLGYIYHKK